MYIDAIESILGRSRKVMLDAKGSGNMLYLPLDKLMDRGGGLRAAPLEGTAAPGAPAAPVQSGQAARPAPEMDTLTIDGRSRGER